MTQEREAFSDLPPLPEPRTLSRGDEDGPIQLGYTADQMHAYARASLAQPATMFNGLTEAETDATASVFGLVGAQPASVPAGWKLVPVEPTDAMGIAGGIAWESSAAMDIIGPLSDAWAAMLAAAPQAPQPAQAVPQLTGCNCRWDGETQVQWCELHAAHKEAIHDWAERAKNAEAKLPAAQPAQAEEAAAPAPEVPQGPRTEFVLNELRSALNAMLTFFGMDEDENSKAVFDKARQAYNYAEIAMRPLEPWERQSLEDFRACVHRWHEKAVAKGYDGVESMCDTALPYGTQDLHLVSPSLAVAAPQPEAQPDERFDWSDLLAISEAKEVDEAIRALLENRDEDNAVCMVRAVIEEAGERLVRLAAPSAQAPQGEFKALEPASWHDLCPPMLVLGRTYKTNSGKKVRMVSISNAGTEYESMADEDGHHRYSRSHSRIIGRCTGSPNDDPLNIHFTPPAEQGGK